MSPAEIQQYERIFYDAACTGLHQDMFIDVVATSATSVPVPVPTHSTASTYQTLTMTLSGVGAGTGSFSIVATDAASSSSPTLGTVGIACNLSTTAVGCGVGAVASQSSVGQDIGVTVGVSATIPAASSGTVTVPVTGNGSSYTGGLGALSLGNGTFANFTVSGGTLSDSATYTGSFSYVSTGSLLGANFTLTDAASDGPVTVTTIGAPATTINGVVKRTSTGQTVATFTTDINGNGTITYGNGSTGQILNWQVLG